MRTAARRASSRCAFRPSTRRATWRSPSAVSRCKIPKGVHEGQIIRLAGQGNAGVGGGSAGDLYLEVHFNPHSRYRVEGRDVYATLPVAPWEAALGASVRASLPDGAVEVRVPEGSQTGRKLRLKGRGIPGTQSGDLYLVLEVVLPPATTAEGARTLSSDGARPRVRPARGEGATP